MNITSGLYEHMVMQRNKRNFCEQTVSGVAVPLGQVTARDRKGRELFSVIAGKDGCFTGKITTLKCGGPYAITLSDGVSSLGFSDIWVGDIWVLAGQSNMQGIGTLAQAPAPIRAVRAYYMDDRWDIAREPVHNMRNAKAEIHWVINGGHDAFDNQPLEIKGVGPGVFFAQEMWKRTHIPQGVIASAHGGTTMTQWNPKLRDQGENSLYGAMYDRVRRNGGKVAGVLWYQGCSDTGKDTVVKYEQRNLELFRAMRKDFKDSRLPIIMVQLGRTTGAYNQTKEALWSRVRDIQRCLPQKLAGMLTVPAIDLENNDTIHLTSESHHALAIRMADAVEVLRGNKNVTPPIVLGSSSCRYIRELQEYEITINFKNVVGKLHSDGQLPLGFTLHHSGEDSLPAVPPFRCKLRGKKAVISVSSELGAKIAYGFGCNPSVNIHDEAGRSLPAFGPVYFQDVPRTTPMLARVEVSEPVMGRDDYESLLPLAAEMKKMKFHKYVADSIYIAPERLTGQGAYRYFFRWQVNCPAEFDSVILIGADGPFRLCCDGKEIAGYPQVPNPVLPDEYSVPLHLTAGKHEFTMGFGGKAGNAWGFCLRYVNPSELLTLENESLTTEYLPELL